MLCVCFKIEMNFDDNVYKVLFLLIDLVFLIDIRIIFIFIMEEREYYLWFGILK